MSGRRSRNKGARAERSVIRELQPVVSEVYREFGLEPPELARNLMQAYRGGFDIVGLDWLALEVKHQERQNLREWWRQTKQQAGEGKEPVLIYKRNNVAWRVRMFGYLPVGSKRIRCPVDIDLPTFLLYVRERIRFELFKSGRGPGSAI